MLLQLLVFHVLCWEGGLSGCHRQHSRFTPLRQRTHMRPRQRVQVSDEPSERPHHKLDLSHVIRSLRMDVNNRSDQAPRCVVAELLHETLKTGTTLWQSVYAKHYTQVQTYWTEEKSHHKKTPKNKPKKRLRRLNVPVPSIFLSQTQDNWYFSL